MQGIVVPGVILYLYARLMAVFFPPGVNLNFVEEVVARWAGVMVAIGLVFVLRTSKQAPESENTARSKWDLLLVFLPLTPIVQYTLLNQDILTISDSLFLVAAFAAAIYLLVIEVPQWLHRQVDSSVLRGLTVGLLFVTFNMAALAEYFTWHERGDRLVQSVILIAAVALCITLYRKERQLLGALCAGLFVVTGIQAVLQRDSTETERASGDGRPMVADILPAQTPDIYLLTYDSYVENETMLQYGIDNSPQEIWLEEQGFRIYRGVYTVGPESISSMGRVFGEKERLRESVSGRNRVVDQLKHAGYSTAGIFPTDYFFQGVGGSYDESFPRPGSAVYLLSMAVFEGEFRHDAHFDKPDRERFLAKKRSIMAQPGERPVFMYTHSGPNHSQNSGRCLDDETQRFGDRLEAANLEMREDVKTLLATRRDKIIIINGDHGPYLTRNCHGLYSSEYASSDVSRLDIQDRYGSFVAIRWPQPQVTTQIKIDRLQDLMPAVLSVLYPETLFPHYPKFQKTFSAHRATAGVTVTSGIIDGGKHAGEALFESSAP